MATAPPAPLINYDGEADVLYISFGAPRPAICIEPEEGLVLRLDPETDQLIGVTIIGARVLLTDRPDWQPTPFEGNPAIWEQARTLAFA